MTRTVVDQSFSHRIPILRVVGSIPSSDQRLQLELLGYFAHGEEVNATSS